MAEFTVRFESGYEQTARIDRETATTSEYWTEITERQNPYDLNDEPAFVDGIEIDSDGEWQEYVDDKLCQALGITTSELYN